MTRAARSVYVFGVYLIVLGGILIGSPNTLLALIRLPAATEPWIYVLGVPVLGMGLLHVSCARAEQMQFFRASVNSRAFAFVALVALALFRIVPPIVAAFGIVDLMSAIWTFVSLRNAALKAAAA